MLVIEKDFNYFHISAPERYQFVKQNNGPETEKPGLPTPCFYSFYGLHASFLGLQMREKNWFITYVTDLACD